MKPTCTRLLVLALTGCLAVAFATAQQQTPQAATPAAAQGVAISIGLNRVNPEHYAGWTGEIKGCEADAQDLMKIAQGQNLDAQILLTERATRRAVTDAIRQAAARLRAGDLFILTYSGHGGQVPDRNGDAADKMDRTWCLYDGQMLDDELRAALSTFKAGVRVLVIADTSNAIQAVKMQVADLEAPRAERTAELRKLFRERADAMNTRIVAAEIRRATTPPTREPGEEYPVELTGEETTETPIVTHVRALDPAIAAETYRQNKDFYDKIGREAPRKDKLETPAAIIMLCGCRDSELAADIGTNGLFTLMLKNVWAAGTFQGDHQRFCEQIREHVRRANAEQQPAYIKLGAENKQFEQQRPFMLKEMRTR